MAIYRRFKGRAFDLFEIAKSLNQKFNVDPQQLYRLNSVAHFKFLSHFFTVFFNFIGSKRSFGLYKEDE